MAEIVSCPACERTLQVPESYFGQMVQCPECKHMFKAEPHTAAVQTTPPPMTPSDSAPDQAQPQERRRRYDEQDDYPETRPIRRGGLPHRGTLILTLGIVALVVPCAAVICGPLAWIMGNSDLEEMRLGHMDPEGEGLTHAGRILGMISLALLAMQGLLFCCMFSSAFA